MLPALFLSIQLERGSGQDVENIAVIRQSSPVVQWGENPAWALQWFGSLLWLGFDPCPGDVHRPQAWPSKQTNKNMAGQGSCLQRAPHLVETGPTYDGSRAGLKAQWEPK